jgi:hypothetical protein
VSAILLDLTSPDGAACEAAGTRPLSSAPHPNPQAGQKKKFWKFYCRIKILQFLLRILFHPVMLKLRPENAGRMGETGAALKLCANGAAVSADPKDMTSFEADCAAASVRAESCPG